MDVEHFVRFVELYFSVSNKADLPPDLCLFDRILVTHVRAILVKIIRINFYSFRRRSVPPIDTTFEICWGTIMIQFAYYVSTEDLVGMLAFVRSQCVGFFSNWTWSGLFEHFNVPMDDEQFVLDLMESHVKNAWVGRDHRLAQYKAAVPLIAQCVASFGPDIQGTIETLEAVGTTMFETGFNSGRVVTFLAYGTYLLDRNPEEYVRVGHIVYSVTERASMKHTKRHLRYAEHLPVKNTGFFQWVLGLLCCAT